jgi:hypothetical protein
MPSPENRRRHAHGAFILKQCGLRALINLHHARRISKRRSQRPLRVRHTSRQVVLQGIDERMPSRIELHHFLQGAVVAADSEAQVVSKKGRFARCRHLRNLSPCDPAPGT